MASCHHPRWLGGVPKGQLIWIRRNCDHQSEIGVNKFKEKGYRDQDLRSIQLQTMEMDRSLLLEEKPKNKSELDFIAFLTNFSRDYKSLEKIVLKLWPLLLRDKTLFKLFPNHPRFI